MRNFRKALVTTVAFVLVFAILSLAFMEFFFAGENYYYQDAKQRKEYAGTIDYMLLGASHCKRGLLPDIIDEELGVTSYNYGGPAFTMKGRYNLLKKELKRNPIKTCVLEMSFDILRQSRKGLGSEGDLFYIGRMDNYFERLSFAFSALYPGELIPAYNFYMNNAIDCAKRIKKGKYHLKNQNIDAYKGAVMYDEDDYRNLESDYSSFYKTGRPSELDPREENLEYFEKIISLLQENDIEIIMVTAPISKKTICWLYGYDEVYSWYKAYADEHNIPYYDFNLMINRDEWLSDARDFHDENHLYTTGARKFSYAFTGILKKAQNGEDVSKYFFESYDAYERTQDYYPEDKK